MKTLLKQSTGFILIVAILAALPSKKATEEKVVPRINTERNIDNPIAAEVVPKYTSSTTTSIKKPATESKIQVAILLDVSGSMSGLIEQAKAQLWNMVGVMGKAKCNDNNPPKIEIALYEYGRSTNDAQKGYVKNISSFTTDLDMLSQNLFALNTNGGEEYCGQVMYTSLTDLVWDTSSTNYKVIFIAGNEDFLQGNVSYLKACTKAKEKGVIINTIYCGDKMQGVREHWNLNSECGNGSYTNINHNAVIEDISTPYDSVLFSLNSQLNSTYIAYGYNGETKQASQARVDAEYRVLNKSVAAKRISVKGKKELYQNGSWDLIDASEKDDKFINKVDVKTLPDSLKTKSRTEIQQIVKTKSVERTNIQKEIASVNVQREAYITSEKAKNATGNTTEHTLETEIEKIIIQQARLFNMVIK